MILGGLSALLQLLCIALVSLLPTYTPPAAADLSAFQVIAWLVPLNEIMTLATVMIAGVIATLTFTLVNWTLNKSRGSG